MKKTKVFDVLVIYSGNTAASASKESKSTTQPFSAALGLDSYNTAYEHFIETCEKHGLTAALSTTADIIGPGKCKSYWEYENKSWHKINNPCYSSHIFDKFSPKSKVLRAAYTLCFSTKEIQPFNSDYLVRLFSDKLKTYQELQDFTIPTVALTAHDSEDISATLSELKELIATHPNRQDFSRTIIMKDRYGSEGTAIYKVTSKYVPTIQKILKENPTFTFILQPFVNFDKGFSYKNIASATDIRLIYQNGKVIQTYIRMAKKNDFRCNQHQGGTLIYTTLSDIPKKVRIASQKIVTLLNQNNTLFALDYIVSNAGQVYFLEGNCGPGIIWDPGYKKDEQMAKQLIQGIVTEFSDRITEMKSNLLITEALEAKFPPALQ